MTPAAFRKLHDAEMARQAKVGPKVSRAKGWCSVCGRGEKCAVATVRLTAEPMRAAFRRAAKQQGLRFIGAGFLGLCLRCAALVAREIGR